MQKTLFVFDLDFTLWDAAGTWCDCTVPPYEKVNSHVIDGDGGQIILYDDVDSILNELKQAGKMIASASRTTAPEIAKQLLELFDIRHFFALEEIYPDCKLTHLNRIKELSGVAFSEMVFFDDEYRNIRDVASLGVACEYVQEGVAWEHVRKYM